MVKTKIMVKTKEVWGEDPEFSGPRNWFRDAFIIRAIKRRKKSGRVLDFGCGSGDLLLRLSQEGFEGIGIDSSSLAVNYFRQKIQERYLEDKLKIILGDEETLFQLKGKFDVVVSGETLEHLKDDSRAVAGFFKLLDEGGICVVTVPAHPWLWDINDEFSGHYRRYEQVDLRQLFEKVGFKVKTIFYWGFPLCLIWHRLLYLPLIRKKMESKKKIIYSNPEVLFGRIVRNEELKRILSGIFYFDQLFNWTKLGGGLLLVAQKP